MQKFEYRLSSLQAISRIFVALVRRMMAKPQLNVWEATLFTIFEFSLNLRMIIFQFIESDDPAYFFFMYPQIDIKIFFLEYRCCFFHFKNLMKEANLDFIPHIPFPLLDSNIDHNHKNYG